MKNILKLVVVSLVFLSSVKVWSTPTTNILLTQPEANRVLELDRTGSVVWLYDTDLHSPQEVIPLTNGNILIADTGAHRIIEVTPRKEIVNVLGTISNSTVSTFTPYDIRMCRDWFLTNGSPTLLIVDSVNARVVEVTYPGGDAIWEYYPQKGLIEIVEVWEAEKRPGAGTPTYLICTGSHVQKVERTSLTENKVVWEYVGNPSYHKSDAFWGPCNNVWTVITWVPIPPSYSTGSSQVIEVEPMGTNSGRIVSTITLPFPPQEAIRGENGNIFVAGGNDNSPTVAEFEGEGSTWNNIWSFGTRTGYFSDVELKGIINVAKIEYSDESNKSIKPTMAGVIVPILQPIISPPYIVATKTVNPQREVTRGETLTYTIAYKNIGPSTATQVTIIDQIPDGTEYLTGSAISSPTAVIEYSKDGENWSSTPTTPVTYIRWRIDALGPSAGGTVGFAVIIK